jgi:hypothetical protein
MSHAAIIASVAVLSAYVLAPPADRASEPIGLPRIEFAGVADDVRVSDDALNTPMPPARCTRSRRAGIGRLPSTAGMASS